MRELQPVTPHSEGIGCGIFFFLFGLCFIVSGIYTATGLAPDAPSLLFLLQNGAYGFAFGSIIFIAFGIMVAWGGLSQANLFRKFGKPKAEIDKELIKPGERFTFIYEQQARRALDVLFTGVFLVYREEVSHYDVSETTTRNVDRLVQQHMHPPQHYAAGEFVRVEHSFEIPASDMGIRNPFMGRKDAKVQTMWVVKVHLHVGKGYDIWHECKIDVAESDTAVEASDAADSLQERFDVVLVEGNLKGLLRITNEMSSLLPHLHSGQIGDLYHNKPCLLLENISGCEAEAAKQKLEAAGAAVHLEPRR